MASIEELCERIFSSEIAWRRCLLGGLLGLSIIGIPFAAGYLYRLAQQANNLEEPELREWSNWQGLLAPGWRFLGLLVLWLLIPMGLFWLVGWLVEEITAGILWWIGYLIAMAGVAIAPVCFIAALMRFLENEQWAAVANVLGIIKQVAASWHRWLVPALLWVGLMVAALPLLPFAFFLGMTVLIPYCIVVVFGSNIAKA